MERFTEHWVKTHPVVIRHLRRDRNDAQCNTDDASHYPQGIWRVSTHDNVHFIMDARSDDHMVSALQAAAINAISSGSIKMTFGMVRHITDLWKPDSNLDERAGEQRAEAADAICFRAVETNNGHIKWEVEFAGSLDGVHSRKMRLCLQDLNNPAMKILCLKADKSKAQQTCVVMRLLLENGGCYDKAAFCQGLTRSIPEMDAFFDEGLTFINANWPHELTGDSSYQPLMAPQRAVAAALYAFLDYMTTDGGSDLLEKRFLSKLSDKNIHALSHISKSLEATYPGPLSDMLQYHILTRRARQVANEIGTHKTNAAPPSQSAKPDGSKAPKRPIRI